MATAMETSKHDQLLRPADKAGGVHLDGAGSSPVLLLRGSSEGYQPTLIDLTTPIPEVVLSPGPLPRDASPYHYPGKRLVDVMLAVVMLAVAAPLLLVLAVLVLFSSGRPVFYSHERVGRYGRHFQCHKLRTMVADADARLQALLLEDADAFAEFAATQKLQNDPRVTAVGRFLRRTSLDELPQFLNVLKGEMSLVGPRPVTFNELERYGGAAEQYLAVRPGVTGLWQVSGRSDASYDDRVGFDLAYVRNMSLTFDLRLVMRTALVVLKRSGAC